MKTMIFTILLTIIGFCILADTTITFSPFTFQMASISKAIGWILIFVGVAFIDYNAQVRGEDKAKTEIIQALEMLQEKTKAEDALRIDSITPSKENIQ